jgi:peptidoglycan-associated lipoprotein
MVRVRIEGHSDLADTRDHALAVGMRRADSVRNFLLLNGVPAAQVTAVSFGKERPATNGPGEAMAALNRRAVTVLVR